MAATVLIANPGSSSRQYAVYRDEQLLLSAYYEHDGDGYRVTATDGTTSSSAAIDESVFDNALEHFLEDCATDESTHPRQLSAIGVRLVAPGTEFQKHQILTDKLYKKLQAARSTAPLHIGVFMTEVDTIRQKLPKTQLFALSDSAFHAKMPAVARSYAIGADDAAAHDIYRFGYHGLSVESVVHQLDGAYQRLIVCHLGSGASITAVSSGKSIDTSMGYSPLEGLVMATRSGNIDIEAALALKQQLRLDDAGLIDYLSHQSGLLGLSQSSADIRVLLEREKADDDQAGQALDTMVYRIQQYIGAYQAALGGLDALIFTATAGERSSILRQRVCDGLSHLGVKLDSRVNCEVNELPAKLSKANSPVAIHVIESDETSQMVRHVEALLAG